jgi:stress response protein SCP2
MTGLDTESIVIVVEAYRRPGPVEAARRRPGYAGGLADLVTDHGVSVDDARARREPSRRRPAAPSAAHPAPGRRHPRRRPRRSHRTAAAAPQPPPPPGRQAPPAYQAAGPRYQRRPRTRRPAEPAAPRPAAGRAATGQMPRAADRSMPPQPQTRRPRASTRRRPASTRPAAAYRRPAARRQQYPAAADGHPARRRPAVPGPGSRRRRPAWPAGPPVTCKGPADLAAEAGRLPAHPGPHGPRWDPIKKRGLFGSREIEIDLDASAVLFADHQPVDIAFFNHLRSNDGSSPHTGDNRTGAGDGDDESIMVEWLGVQLRGDGEGGVEEMPARW